MCPLPFNVIPSGITSGSSPCWNSTSPGKLIVWPGSAASIKSCISLNEYLRGVKISDLDLPL